MLYRSPADLQSKISDTLARAPDNLKPVLREIFWKINAHPELITFRSLCANLKEIIAAALYHWGKSEEDLGVAGWMSALEWIITGSIFKDDSPYDEYDRLIMMHKGVSRHPLYAALLYQHSDENLKLKYRLLQAHLLVSHISIMSDATVDKNEWSDEREDGEIQQDGETTAGEEEPDETPAREAYFIYTGSRHILTRNGSDGVAARAVRILSEVRHVFARQRGDDEDEPILEPDRSPEEFANRLELFPPRSERARARDIVLYLLIGLGLRKPRQHGGGGGSSGEEVHGKSWEIEYESEITDPDGEDGPTGTTRILRKRPRGIPEAESEEEKEEESRDREEIDEPPDEGREDTPTLDEVNFDKKAGDWEAAVSVARQIDRRNQHFRWEYDHLGASELKPLLIDKTNEWLNNLTAPADKEKSIGWLNLNGPTENDTTNEWLNNLKAPADKEKRIEWLNNLERVANDKELLKNLELISLVNVMFWTSQPIESALELFVSDSTLSAAEFGLQLGKDGGTWYMPSVLPQRVHTYLPAEDAARTFHDYFHVSDLSRTHELLLALYLIKLPGEQQQRPAIRHVKVFRSLKASTALNQLLESMDKQIGDKVKEKTRRTRATRTRLANYLYQKVMEMSHGDATAAALITGRKLPFASVRLYYACRSLNDLRFLHLRTVRSIQLELGIKRTGVAIESSRKSSAVYVTNQVCPTREEVRSRVLQLKTSIRELSKAKDEEKRRLHFNLFTLYSVWTFSFAVGIRGIRQPFIDPVEIGPDGIATLADKDSGSGYKRRIIWLPKFVAEQVKSYREFIKEYKLNYFGERISTRQFKEAIERCLCVFLLREDANPSSKFKAVEVRPATQRLVMNELERRPDGGPFFNFPINTHRRFMLGELARRGCPPQVRDAWMGHWSRAEEPWGPYSSFYPTESVLELGNYIPAIMKDLGFCRLSRYGKPWTS